MIIDSVMDYNPASARTSEEHNAKVIALVEEKGLEPQWIVETHVHAEHLTGAKGLKARFPAATTGIGEHVVTVQKTFKALFNLGDDFSADGSQFEHLFKDGETFKLGDIDCRIIHTPGHTPACVVYVIGDAAFTGDTIFMPDFGSARCDFPGGSAEQLYSSIRKLYELPDSTRLFVGHDYQPGGRELKFETSVAEEKAENKHVKAETSEMEFVEWRTGRDAKLGAPRLILPALQVNLRNGALPPPEDNGTSYIKIPLNILG
jgi:glyoxylase-like metal-dependent hydrolase (beta-lactamase superfamily II)